MKKYKIFGSGMIRGIDYTKEKLKEVFETDSVKAIFGHTSEYSDEKTILELGEFKEFEIKDDGVYSKLSLNEFGDNLKKSGALKGISIELDAVTKKLSKIALLPIFQKQAIIGAEFKDTEYILEFKRGEDEMNEKEIREDERRRVKLEMETEFKATALEIEKAKELEFATKLKTEVEKLTNEFKLKADLDTAKREALSSLEKKLPEVARKGYEFALNKADSLEDEIFKTIEGLKDLKEGSLKDIEFKLKDKDIEGKETADYTLNFLKGVR